MKVWLQHKTNTDREFDFDLIELTPGEDEDDDWVRGEPFDGTEASLDRTISAWLHYRTMMAYGDRWYGDEIYIWTLVEQPPVEWFEKELAYAEAGVRRAMVQAEACRRVKEQYYPTTVFHHQV